MSVPSYAGLKRYATTGTDVSGLGLDNNDNRISNKNNMSDLLGSIISGGAGLINGVINAFSQKSANDANIKMQRETNAHNLAMMREQNAWNLEQWNRENAYNDPAEQAKRLQAAGINPNMVFGNGSIAESSSLQSASANPAVAPHVDPLFQGDHLAQGVYTGINAYNQSQLINAQVREIAERTHGLSIQNQLDRALLLDRIDSLRVDNDTKRTLLDVYKRTADDEVAYKKGLVTNQDANTKYINEQISYLEFKKGIEDKLANSTVKLNDAQVNQLNSAIREINANIGFINARTDLTKQEKINLVENKVGIILDNGLKALDYEQKEKLNPILLSSSREELFKLQDDRFLRPFDLNYRSKGKFGMYYPDPSGSYGSSLLFDRNKKRDRFSY